MPIEGKVAAILNERDLVINKGSEAGVREGMKFKVIESEMDIRDPDTGADLGSISQEKIRVKIVEVRPKFSIGKTYETYIDFLGPLVEFPFLPPPKLPVTKVRTLRPDSTTRFEPMGEESSFVKVGDPAIQAEDEV